MSARHRCLVWAVAAIVSGLGNAVSPCLAQDFSRSRDVGNSRNSSPAQDVKGVFGWLQDAPSRGAPATASSWRVSIAPGSVAVAADDPNWTAHVRTTSKAPLLVANPIPRAAPRTQDPVTGRTHMLQGIASYYWQEQTTATGERFDRTAMTAAHRTLPLNTRVRVTNVVNGRSVIVRINDRGPFKPGRILDLSEAAANQLDMTKSGVVPVKIQVISN